jgi:2'-5' RNA ligase
MRLFVSVDLPLSLADTVETVQAEFSEAAGLSFVDPKQAHFTLKFLGDTNPERLDKIKATLRSAVDEADVEPFNCTVGGLGVFPSLDYITVVWLGVREGKGAAELTRLHEAVEAEMTALGFEAESHEFTPHITLARMDDARGKSVVQEVVEESDPTVGTFRVKSVRLTESTLTDSGPKYETVAEVDL